jgi:crotonobetainyl-CoA:carnitine CoA-transferase CaiB-like acyl-CoA transferase
VTTQPVDGQPRALEGVRVLDLGTFIAAPFCGTLLAEFGADVIKVEQPGAGDSLRTLGEEAEGAPLFWLQEARNKRTIACDLRQPTGQRIVRDLVAAGYDIVLENFRPGTLDRWGLGYEALREVDPGVILVQVSGYGQTGPARDKPGFGRIAHAFGCLTYLSGFPDRPPVNPGSATIADYAAGLFAAFGVLAAREHRSRTGQGQKIDVALYEAIFRMMDNLAVTYSATGTVRERSGTATPLAAPHNHYPTQDGKWIAVACTNDRIFARLAEALGQPELAQDERFRSARERVANRDALDAIVNAWTGRHTLRQAVAQLDAAQVPCSPIYSIADAFDDAQYRARGTLETVAYPLLGALQMPAVIPRLSETPGRIEWLGRELGQDTEAILRDVLAYSADCIRDLRQARAIS